MRSILFIHTGGNVEFLLSLPALVAARDHFPRAEITLVASDFGCDVAQIAGCVDKTVSLGQRQPSPGRPNLPVFKLLGAFARLRIAKFDVAVNLHTSNIEGILTFLAGARERVGVRTGGLLSSALTQHAPEPRPGCHLTDQYNDLIEIIGVRELRDRVRLPVPTPALRAMDARLEKAGWRGGLLIAFHPTVGFPPQVWPAEEFVELGLVLMAEFGTQIVLLETPDEPGLNTRLMAEFRRKTKHLPIPLKRLTVPDTLALLARCTAIVGNNGAPVHLASMVGTPAAVVMDGSWDSSITAVRGARHRLVYGSTVKPVAFDDVFGITSEVLQSSRTASLFEA
jgi:ADP-heptose:LPS heptosyltransferase